MQMIWDLVWWTNWFSFSESGKIWVKTLHPIEAQDSWKVAIIFDMMHHWFISLLSWWRGCRLFRGWAGPLWYRQLGPVLSGNWMEHQFWEFVKYDVPFLRGRIFAFQQITWDFDIETHIQGTTMRKLTPRRFRKCGSFWTSEFRNGSYRCSKLTAKLEKVFLPPGACFLRQNFPNMEEEFS